MPQLTTVIMTWNESRNIRDAVRSLAGLPGEILVVDHASEDGTPELAMSLGCRVVTEHLEDISLARNLALSEARGEWILFLDADERMTPGLAGEISSHMENGSGRAASFTRRNVAFGRRFRFGPLWPDRVVRLFPRDHVRWVGLVHERPVTDLPVARLGGWVFHHTYPDWGTYVDKQALYARLWAENCRGGGKAATPAKAFARAFFAFLKMMFLKLGILDGPAGWCLCWYNSGAYTLGKYLLLADGTEPGRGAGQTGRKGGGAGAAEAGDPAREPGSQGRRENGLTAAAPPAGTEAAAHGEGSGTRT
ncbi:MAG: glycosyltransferase family 2 protein [Deltaproteobacteria bacterium]|jgi:glycosyltransferase involved in cell wall biosynthesis|nr:glycosyltransferase family 2 protein [Deltaproteobacteria bacterium]